MKKITMDEAHATAIGYDKLLYQIAEMCVSENITPKRAVANLVTQAVAKQGFRIFLSGSSFTAAAANPIHFIMQKALKVFFGLNAKLIIGSAYHKALERAFAYKIATGKTVRMGVAIREIVKYIHGEYPKIKADQRAEVSKQELIQEAIRLYKVYHKHQLPNNTPQEVEVFMSLPAPMEMLRNPENAGKIFLSGAFDVMLGDDDGILIMTDAKTSDKRISGSVDMDPKLVEYKNELSAAKAELSKVTKVIEKFAGVEEEIAEKQTELMETELDLAVALEKKKAHKALDNKIERISKIITTLGENLKQRIEAEKKAAAIWPEIENLEEVIAPLQEIYDEEKAEADLIECRKRHGQQLAFYALLYMILYGKEVKRVRIENMVKSAVPELQVFEWELDEFELMRAEEEIQSNITLIEMVLDGEDPMVLFRLNTTSYIGDETIKFFDEVEKIVREQRKSIQQAAHAA